MPGSKTSSSGSADGVARADGRAWLLYDRDCGVCKVIVARILDLDRGGHYVPLALQDPRAADLLPGLTPEERLRSFHIVEPDGTVHSAGEGLAELLPPLRRLPGVASRVYWLVASNRTKLGRLVPGAARRQAERRIAEAQERLLPQR